MTNEELCAELRNAGWDIYADRIEALEQENKRLDAGWHEANAFALKQGLRADAAENALTQSRAETAAAYERAAEVAKNGGFCFAIQIEKTIRAIATPEQSAALDAVKGAARAQGMREAAKLCDKYLFIDEIKTAILAAIQKGEPK